MSKDRAPGNPSPHVAIEKSIIPIPGILTAAAETFGLSRSLTLTIIILSWLVLAGSLFFFIHSAPSNTLTITCGPEGSIFYANAEKYSKILARHHVKLNLLVSHGSLENLQRLGDPKFNVDVGFVQDGLTSKASDNLVSLGSISYQPLFVFYRGTTIESLSALAGKRLAIGPVGSGTRTLVLSLLEANDIKPGGQTTLLDWEPQQAYLALLAGTTDAVSLMGEDASLTIMRNLLREPGINLMNFSQAEAYTRRFTCLNVLRFPQGSIDLGQNIPAHDVNTIGPTVELIARKNLHPALSDLLLETAREVHGHAGLIQRKGEFPSPIEHDYPISADASRFYKSGTTFFYRYLPYRLASLTDRIVVVFLPTIVILFPILRFIPSLYRWRIQSQIYRWYRSLLELERDLFNDTGSSDWESRMVRLDEIEKAVNKMKVPAYFADQFYALRGHIAFVREMIKNQLPH